MVPSPKRKGGPLARPPAKRTTTSSKAGPVLASRHRSDIKAVFEAYSGLYAADTAPASALDGHFQRVLDGATGKFPRRLFLLINIPCYLPILKPSHRCPTPHPSSEKWKVLRIKWRKPSSSPCHVACMVHECRVYELRQKPHSARVPHVSSCAAWLSACILASPKCERVTTLMIRV